MKIKVKRNHLKAIITGHIIACIILLISGTLEVKSDYNVYADELKYSVICQCGTTISITPENSSSLGTTSSCTSCDNCTKTANISNIYCPTCGRPMEHESVAVQEAIVTNDAKEKDEETVLMGIILALGFGIIILMLIGIFYVIR